MFESAATYVAGGGQHLDLAKGVSSLFPGQVVWVTTTKDVASTDSQAQFESVIRIMLACTNSPAQADAQWPFLRRFGHNLDLQGWSF